MIKRKKRDKKELSKKEMANTKGGLSATPEPVLDPDENSRIVFRPPRQGESKR